MTVATPSEHRRDLDLDDDPRAGGPPTGSSPHDHAQRRLSPSCSPPTIARSPQPLAVTRRHIDAFKPWLAARAESVGREEGSVAAAAAEVGNSHTTRPRLASIDEHGADGVIVAAHDPTHATWPNYFSDHIVLKYSLTEDSLS